MLVSSAIFHQSRLLSVAFFLRRKQYPDSHAVGILYVKKDK